MTSIACNLLVLHPQLYITLLINPLAVKSVEAVIGEHRTPDVRDDGRLKVVGCLVDRVGFSMDGIWEELDQE